MMTPMDERNDGGTTHPQSTAMRGRGRLAAISLVALTALTCTGLTQLVPERKGTSRPVAGEPPTAAMLPKNLFRDWDSPIKPDMVILLSAQEHGYLLPCGCSRPQKGGLERRYNLAEMLRERFGAVAAFDLGDIPQLHGPASLPNEQGLLKYAYSMKALRAIGYEAVGVGEYEAALPLEKTIGAWALNENDDDKPGPKVLSANLTDDTHFIRPWRLVKTKGTPLKIGVTSIVGPMQKGAITEMFKNDRANLPAIVEWSGALNKTLTAMNKEKADLRILLFHGLARLIGPGKPEAVAVAEQFPQFPLILCLSEEDEPASNPIIFTNPKTKAETMLVSLGHKGKHVGVVGVWKTGKAARPYEYRYQLVELTEEFLTPPDKEKGHPVSELMEDYTRDLKKDNYLARYPQRTHELQTVAPPLKEPTFVGSERCGDCHAKAYEVWKKSAHSHAYKTLEDAKRPSLRQYDPECIVCHTVGFGFKSGFKDATANAKLKNVGCESCHGPGSAHVNDFKNEAWHKLMNPWKEPAKEKAGERAARILRMDHMCQGCHDTENDVHWTGQGFEKKWPAIEHHTPKE